MADPTLPLPFEFVVEGVPVSYKLGRGGSRDRWKERVASAAEARIKSGREATASDGLFVRIYIFPRDRLPGDLDNKVKPILDALTGVVYEDDAQVKRLDVRALEPESDAIVTLYSDLLFDAVAGAQQCVYVRISDDLTEGD